MTSVEIIVGHTWKDDVRFLSELRHYRPIDSPLNLIEIRDIIDIVVDGNNITSSIPEESIFGMLGELVEALSRLSSRQCQKAIIEFHCEPWELVLVPSGRKLLLSVYSIDRHHRVVADNLAIDADRFIEAVSQAGETLLTDLFRISEKFSADSFVRRFSSQLAQLKRSRSAHFPRLTRRKKSESYGQRLGSTSCSGGLSLSYSFDADWPHLVAYCSEHAFDLHTLLFPGAVEAELDGESVTISDEYPFLTIVSLMGRVRELLNLLEVKEEQFVCDEPLAYGCFDVFGRGSHWQLALSPVPGASESVYVHPHDCLDGLLSLAEMFVKDLVALNPHLELNQRLVDLDEEVRNLRSWQQDLCGNNLYHDRPEDYLRRLGHIEPVKLPPADPPRYPWALSSVRAMFPRTAWHFEASQIAFDRIVTTGHDLIVPSADALTCVDRAAGTVRWEHRFSERSERAAHFTMAGDLAVVADAVDGLQLLDAASGAVRAANASQTQWAGLLGAAHFASEQTVVVADVSGRVAGFSSADGTVRWEHHVGIGRLCGLAVSGPLVSVLSTESFITTVNPLTGEILWKVRLGGLPDVWPRYHQGRLYCFTHDMHHRTVTVHAFYPFTGRTVWQLRLPGAVAGTPSFLDQWLVVPIERHGQIVLEGIDIEAIHPCANWTLELSSAGLYQPTAITELTLDDGTLCGLVKTDRAELTCFRACDGAVNWQLMPATETLLLYGNLPLVSVEEAVLVVNDSLDLRCQKSGRLLHSFFPVEAPEFVSASGALSIVIGEQGTHADDVDTLTGLALDRFLAVVE